jgi:hypothetical protein
VVAAATKLRPYSPRVAHGASDAGLPEAVGVVGATTPGAVVVSYCPKRLFAQSRNPSTITSRVSSTIATTSTAAVTP